MRKKRVSESPEERSQRTRLNAKRRDDNKAADEAALDARVRRNIEQHGP